MGPTASKGGEGPDHGTRERHVQQDQAGSVQRRSVRDRHHAADPRRRRRAGRLTARRRSSAPGRPTSEYIVSFLTIGGAWIGHSALTDDLDHVDAVFLRLNLPAAAVRRLPAVPDDARHGGFRRSRRRACCRYGLRPDAARHSPAEHGARRVRTARGPVLGRPGGRGSLARSRRKDAAGVILYVVAIATGLLLPGIAVAVYFAIALFLVIPFREIGRVRRRRAPRRLVRGRAPRWRPPGHPAISRRAPWP